MDSNIEIKSTELVLFEGADCSFVFEIYKKVWFHYLNQYFDWDETWQKEYVKNTFDFKHLYILRRDDRPIGYVEVQIDTCTIFISRLDIIPRYQRSGIGGQTLRKINRYSNKINKSISLYSLKKNINAINFYKSHNFVVTDGTDEYLKLVHGVSIPSI